MEVLWVEPKVLYLKESNPSHKYQDVFFFFFLEWGKVHPKREYELEFWWNDPIC